jgi:hypothetical protein
MFWSVEGFRLGRCLKIACFHRKAWSCLTLCLALPRLHVITIDESFVTTRLMPNRKLCQFCGRVSGFDMKPVEKIYSGTRNHLDEFHHSSVFRRNCYILIHSIVLPITRQAELKTLFNETNKRSDLYLNSLRAVYSSLPTVPQVLY